jgi:hypothetical protein
VVLCGDWTWEKEFRTEEDGKKEMKVVEKGVQALNKLFVGVVSPADDGLASLYGFGEL